MTETIYEDDKELDVYESRILNKQYSDDTWQLTGYTSELRNNNDNSFFAFVDFNEDGTGSVKECPHYLTYEIHNKLGPKIKKKGEPIAPDDDKWLSCYECGNTFPAHQTFADSEIKDPLETIGNPFEEHESITMSVSRRRRKNRLLGDEDPDIAEEIRKHGADNVHAI
jgi:hypothetical protein